MTRCLGLLDLLLAVLFPAPARSADPDERITPFQALKAITLDAAYMYQEEKTKGSLEAGKLADLVILDKNPLKVEPITIKDIKVLETIKEGKTIYAAK